MFSSFLKRLQRARLNTTNWRDLVHDLPHDSGEWKATNAKAGGFLIELDFPKGTS
jgi:hypothetical protein